MYRVSSIERRNRAVARRHELSKRAQVVLGSHRYGRVARGAVTELLAGLDAEDLEVFEAGLDALEEALAMFVADATREAEQAERFRALGQPSADAETFTGSFSRFLFTGTPSASDRKEIVSVLLSSAARWTPQMGHAPLVEAHLDALAFYFEHDGAPLRLDIVAKPFDDGGYYDEATLSAAVPRAALDVEISIRPQTIVAGHFDPCDPGPEVRPLEIS